MKSQTLVVEEENGPIRRQALFLTLADRIRSMIVEHVLAPGDKIDEKNLCLQFGTSRTPLREALKVLSSEGLVELMPNRSSRVATLNRNQVIDMFNVMSWLDREAGRLAAKKATKADIEGLYGLHAQMKELYRNKNRVMYFRKNGEMHSAIVHIAGNHVLSRIYDELLVNVQRARFAALEHQEHWTRGIKEHQEIIDALAAGDSRRAAKALSEHTHFTGQYVANFFPDD